MRSWLYKECTLTWRNREIKQIYMKGMDTVIHPKQIRYIYIRETDPVTTGYRLCCRYTLCICQGKCRLILWKDPDYIINPAWKTGWATPISYPRSWVYKEFLTLSYLISVITSILYMSISCEHSGSDARCLL